MIGPSPAAKRYLDAIGEEEEREEEAEARKELSPFRGLKKVADRGRDSKRGKPLASRDWRMTPNL